MNIALGQVIKKLRQEKGITQELLAAHFGLSCQAISKWETGTTFPDITLLPELAIFFGVTIDSLFSISRDDHLTRIDNMLNNEFIISHENFVYGERVLNEILEENPKDSAAYVRKGRMHLHRANSDTIAASRNAVQGLEISPFDIDLHGIYINVRRQRQENSKLIQFYEEFTAKYPNWMKGYFYLIEGYIRERKLKQASETIEKAKAVKRNPMLSLYEGDICLLNGEKDNAARIWETTAEDNETDPSILEKAADRLAKLEYYDKAILLWNKAYEIPPHYLGSLYSMAFLFNELGRYEESIKEWERILYAQKTYWNASEGAILDWPRHEIELLKQKTHKK